METKILKTCEKWDEIARGSGENEKKEEVDIRIATTLFLVNRVSDFWAS